MIDALTDFFSIFAVNIKTVTLMKFWISHLLILRCKQLFRIACQLGVLRTFLVLGLLVVTSIAAYLLIAAGKDVFFVASLYLILCLLIHLKRSDKEFLNINAPHFRAVFFIEYMIFVLPLIIFLLLYVEWLVLVSVVIGILIVSTANFTIGKRRKTFNTHVQKYIPFDLYEWQAGVRKNFIVLLIVNVLGICLSWLVAAIPVTMIISGLIITDFLITPEPWPLLLSFEKNAAKMLLHKMKLHILLYTICSLPLIILFFVLHHDLWYIPVIVYSALISIHLCMITIKYAHYSIAGSNHLSPFVQFLVIFTGLTVIALPLLLLFSAVFFEKACVNLKPLFHDFD